MLATTAASAGAANLEGVWLGHIGKNSVVACFDSATTGSYYYTSHLYGIELWLDASGRNWNEETDGGESTGTWRDLVVVDSDMSGQWVAPSAGKPVSIRMHKTSELAPAENDESCRTAAYDEPRLRATTLKSSPVKQVSGHSVITLSARNGELTVVQIQEPGHGIDSLNQTLRRELSQRIVESYECIQSDSPGEFIDRKDEIKYFKDGLIAIGETFNGTCGGPYPASSLTVFTYDAMTGEDIDTSQWIRLEKGNFPPELLRLIAGIEFAPRNGNSPEDEAGVAECRAAWLDQDAGFVVWPAVAGLYFSPQFPHVIQACGDDVLVPFKRLEPFLSDAGRKALRRSN